MSYLSILISHIDIGDRLRPINPAWVEALAREIAEGATLSAIEVVDTGAGTYRLITGAHRLAAAAQAGHTEIEARVWPADAFVDESELRLKEVQENILRFELTELDRAISILTWKGIYEDAKPKPKRGRKPAQQIGAETARIFAERFSTAAARAIGISERSIQVAVQIATNISPEVRARISGDVMADSQSELLQLAAQAPDRQAKILDLLLSDPPGAGSVAEAIAVLDRVPMPSRLAPWERVSDRFGRLPALEQDRFFTAHAEAVDRWLATRRTSRRSA